MKGLSGTPWVICIFLSATSYAISKKDLPKAELDAYFKDQILRQTRLHPDDIQVQTSLSPEFKYSAWKDSYGSENRIRSLVGAKGVVMGLFPTALYGTSALLTFGAAAGVLAAGVGGYYGYRAATGKFNYYIGVKVREVTDSEFYYECTMDDDWTESSLEARGCTPFRVSLGKNDHGAVYKIDTKKELADLRRVLRMRTGGPDVNFDKKFMYSQTGLGEKAPNASTQSHMVFYRNLASAGLPTPQEAVSDMETKPIQLSGTYGEIIQREPEAAWAKEAGG